VRSVPIEAIARPDGGDLVDRFAVQYAPSATIYAWLREQARSSRASPADRRALLVGDPPFREEHVAEIPADGGIETVSYALTAVSDSALSRVLRGERDALGSLPRLAWARREIDGIAAVTKNADRLVGQDASEARLRAIVSDGRMGHYDVVHFATHAIIDNERPEISTLVLSQVKDAEAPAPNAQAQAIDGIVSASEIMREWSLDAELAVLSGCETALGLRTIDGTWGLAQTFLQAGARSVVVSLWPVDDEATALLMTKFYELWTAPPAAEPARTVGAPPPAGKAGALSAAKRWLRDLEDPIGSRRFAHPYFWSGFVLIGDGS
jgi:CHAT domain-containing protein